MTNFRDIEQLSAYLDGQLSPSESARLESRIASDPSLASAFNDIRAARGILRKLPARKAPRNFTLTRQMVGLKPPLPRSYSLFRFSTAFATFLLMLTFAANTIVPRVNFAAVQAPPGSGGGCEGCGVGGGGGGDGLGGGGACEPPSCIPPALAAPLATEAPAAVAEAPAATEAPLAEFSAPAATESSAADSANSAREAETPTAEALPKEPATESASPNQNKVKSEAVIPLLWQVILLALGLVSGLIMFLLNRSAKQKWK